MAIGAQSQLTTYLSTFFYYRRHLSRHRASVAEDSKSKPRNEHYCSVLTAIPVYDSTRVVGAQMFGSTSIVFALHFGDGQVFLQV